MEAERKPRTNMTAERRVNVSDVSNTVVDFRVQ